MYVLHGGWITSKNDGQRHWVSETDLPHLYRLPPGSYRFAKLSGNRRLDEIPLYPRNDGNYTFYPNKILHTTWRCGGTSPDEQAK